MKNFAFLLIFICSYHHVVGQAVEQLGISNFDKIINSHELVLVNFYADWCKFSRMLEPVFEDTAKLLMQEFPKEDRIVLLGKLDCERENKIAQRYNVNKYPTIKMFKNGKVQKREYRGQRSQNSLADYVRNQMESPIQKINNLDDIEDILDKSKRNIIGYFKVEQSPEHAVFKKVSSTLRDDCKWFAAYGEVAASQLPGGSVQIVFKPPHKTHSEMIFSGPMLQERLLQWAQDKCVPLVREITFENAEELTEEGLPFLILFHKKDDTVTPQTFTDMVHKHLIDEKDSINFLTADGAQFAHPLHHLGKTINDLPVLTIDSFKHMYLFPDINKMTDPAALKKFISDLHSGKLHREFHHGPDAEESTTTSKEPEVMIVDIRDQENFQRVDEQPKTSPPESQFVKLAPSELRYSFKDYKDEL